MSQENNNRQPVILVETASFNPSNNRMMKDVSFKETGQQIIEISSDIIQHAVKELSSLAKDMLDQIKKAGPDEVELELGLKVGVDAKVLVSLKGDANFNLKMKWTGLNSLDK